MNDDKLAKTEFINAYYKLIDEVGRLFRCALTFEDDHIYQTASEKMRALTVELSEMTENLEDWHYEQMKVNKVYDLEDIDEFVRDIFGNSEDK